MYTRSPTGRIQVAGPVAVGLGPANLTPVHNDFWLAWLQPITLTKMRSSSLRLLLQLRASLAAASGAGSSACVCLPEVGCSSSAIQNAMPMSRGFAAAAAAPLPTRAAGTVPPGHINSDLSPNVCHIGLGRRRDLSMRQDLCLYADGRKLSLRELFKGKKSIVVGFPGGPVCTEKHIPGYVGMTEAFNRKGVDQVVCITPMSPEELKELSSRPELKSSKVQLVSDKNGSFIRMMGLELGDEASKGPKCQRFAGIVEDGILLKVKVERTPAELEQTDARSMCTLWEEVYGHLPNVK